MTAPKSQLEEFFSSATGQAVLDAFVKSTPTMLLIADVNGKILRESRYSAEVRGLGSPHETEGLTIAQLLETFRARTPDGRPLEPKDSVIVRALNGEPARGHEVVYSTIRGEDIPVVSNAEPIRVSGGEVIGAISAGTDLRRFKALERELRIAIAEKEMLYRELAHRVKNHLSIIAGLINLETREAKTVAEMGERMSGRLKMLAGVYGRLIQAEMTGHVPALAFIEDVVSLYRTASVSIDVTAPERLTLSPDAAGPFGMLVNEAVANSYKHAFPDRSGRIEVTLRESPPDGLELTIADDGKGWATPTDRPSQGLKLMRLLAQQLGGEMETSERIGGGAQVLVRLPGSLGECDSA